LNPTNQRVKELRTKLKLSQEEFGNAIGLSKSGVSNIENGTRAVRNNHIRLIHSEFGVSEEWLRTGKDLAVETTKIESFITFLKSLSYLVNIQTISETECEITLLKDGVETVLSESQFIAIQNEVADVINYQLWQQSKKPPSVGKQ
jgi:transcriptional regulator with XRE-family HTH domain